MKWLLEAFVLFSWLVSSTVTFGVGSSEQENAWSKSSLRTEETPILSAGPDTAATDLKAEAQCSQEQPGLGVAELSWTVAKNPGSSQRIDITMFRDGFEKSTFNSIGPIPADKSSLESEGIEPGINYYWRILTLTSNGWVPSETARCEGPICPVDGRRPR